MPERWERELEKLNDVDAPVSTRARIAEGSHGEGVPPPPGRSQRVVAGVVAFAVFGGALAFALGAFRDGDGTTVVDQGLSDAVVVTLLAERTGPTATMNVDGEVADGYGSSTCWEQEPGVVGCSDVVGPSFTVEDLIRLDAGRALVIEGDADRWTAELAAFPIDDYEHVMDVPFEDRVGMVPDEPGRYVLVISATWSRGDRQFFFPVRIVPPRGSPTPASDALVAALRAPEDGSMPGLTLSYGPRKREYYAQGGAWPGVNGFTLPLFSFPDPLIPGDPLRIEGDASSVEGELVVVQDGSLSDETIRLDLTEGVADLPTEAGFYELRLTGTWSRGTAAYFVRIQIGELEPAEPSPLPSVEPGVVPEAIGVGEGDAIKALAQAGYEVRSEYVPTGGVTAGIVVSLDPSPGTALDPGSTVHLVVSGTTVALDGYLTDLACPAGDMMPFAHTGVAVLEPAGESYIRVNVSGIQPSDAIVQVLAEPNDDVGRGIWNLERTGQVLAVIDWETLQGIACRGSGVGGV